MENKVLDALIKATKNPQLKEELKKDPKKYLMKHAGLELPPSTKLTIVENTPKKYYFVLASISAADHSPEDEVTSKMKDPSFREQIKKNPRKILTEQFHQTLLDDCHIEILEQTDEQYYLVLPNQLIVDEISDAEMQAISAGFGGKGLGMLGKAFWEGVVSGITALVILGTGTGASIAAKKSKE